ncbi:hypothetical protein [Amphibiibacter pelophylacis]|uniref:Uncharacterized protein n=1 Tax=Amphibiibacter pelophylacis TaxID=1799477 RepID=A0ACC6NY88_9BURK
MVSPHSASSLNLGAPVSRATESAPAPDASLDPSTWQRLMDDPAALGDDELDRLLAAWNVDPAVRQTWLAHHLAQEALQGPVHAPLMSSSSFLHEFRQRRDILPLDDLAVRTPTALAQAPALPVRLRQMWQGLQRGRYTWPVLSAITACALTVLALPALQGNAVPWATPAAAPVAATAPAAPATPASTAEAAALSQTAVPAADAGAAMATASDAAPDASTMAVDTAETALDSAGTPLTSEVRTPRYGRSTLGTPGWTTGSLSDTGYVGQGFRWQHGASATGLGSAPLQDSSEGSMAAGASATTPSAGQ